MPRSKTIKTEEAELAAPKRARKAPAKKAASTAAPQRMRVLSAEEKRQLILAHAAMRQPVDSTQRFSLWMGVAICLAVIAVGWFYMTHKSIVTAYQNNSPAKSLDEQINEAMGAGEDDLFANLHDVVEQIEIAEQENFRELELQAAAVDSLKQTLASSSAAATTTDGGRELFQAIPDTPTQPLNNFELPKGIKIDN
ncbi:MAG: hypothetical protein ACOYUZ_05080 [Patescibacteria group bacterium]